MEINYTLATSRITYDGNIHTHTIKYPTKRCFMCINGIRIAVARSLSFFSLFFIPIYGWCTSPASVVRASEWAVGPWQWKTHREWTWLWKCVNCIDKWISSFSYGFASYRYDYRLALLGARAGSCPSPNGRYSHMCTHHIFFLMHF